MVGRDKSRRSLTGNLVKQARRKARRRRTREPIGEPAEKYVALRAGLSPSIWLDEILDQQLRTHLSDEYANPQQMGKILKLTGYIEMTRKRMKWTATRADMKRWFAMAEKQRWEKKFKLTRAEAVTRFVTGKTPRPVSSLIPSQFKAKPTTPYYPRPGSSAGKISTKIIGANQVERDFANLMKTLFSLGDSFKGPNVKVKRTYTKTIDFKE